MVKNPTDDEDIDSLIAMAEGELSQVGNASNVGDTDDVDSLIAMAEQEITQPDEKGDYGWFKNEMSKHGQEFMQDPSAGPLIKMGGDVARSFGYTMGKVFEPVTKPIVEGVTQHLSRVVPEGEKQFVKDAVAGGTEAYRKAIPDEGVRDLISSTGSIISLGLGAKGIGAGESAKGLASATGKAAEGSVKGAAKLTGDALVNLDNFAGRIAEGSTKVSEEALRMSGTKPGREALKDAANKQFEIGKELVDMIDNADEFIPERAIVENALNDMPDINMKPVLNAIEKAKVYEASPTAIAANKRLDGLKDIYLKLSKQNIDVPIMQKGATGTESGLQVYNPNALATDAAQQVGTAKATVDVPLKATDFREVRRQLDNEIKSAFDKDPGEATEFEKQARRIRLVMKNELVKAAEKSGNKEYVEAMKTWSDKIDKVDAIKSFLGKNATTRANRVESFVANLFNKNKSQQQKTLQDISQVFGKDFVEKSRLTYLANQLGDEGTASWLPQWTTGRGKIDNAAGLVFGSPKIASRVTLPITGKIGEVGKKLKSFGEKSSLKDIRTK